MRLAVVGGGIADLAAAWEARSRAEVTVFEPGRLGGRILTTDFAGHPVDEGPDAFLVRVPEAVDLCRELGLAGELVAPAAGRSAIWFRGALRPLPEGLVLGVPRDLLPVVRSGLLSPAGMARAALDLVLPRQGPVEGLTVRQLVAGRFGAQVADRLVDPLVGGIHAGWTGDLGVAEVAPQIAAVAERSRSLVLGLRAAAPASSGGVVFQAPRTGMGRLVEALVAGLRAAGVRFVDRHAESVRSPEPGTVLVDPDPEPYDAAVVTTPARVAADLLGGFAGLVQIPTASVVLVTAAVDGPIPAGFNGFLVPKEEGHLMTAGSFGSNKWPHWSEPGRAVVRLSAGRYRDERATGLDDGVLADRLLDELGRALSHSLSASEVRVSRWPDAFPQYRPGHRELVASAEHALRTTHPTVSLAGASYHGPGIPACIGSGRRAAAAVLERSRLIAS